MRSEQLGNAVQNNKHHPNFATAKQIDFVRQPYAKVRTGLEHIEDTTQAFPPTCPATPSPRFVIHLVSRAQAKNIQTICRPRNNLWCRVENTTQILPPGLRWAPSAARSPIFMIHPIIGPKPKDIQASRSPGHRCDLDLEHTTKGFPSSQRRKSLISMPSLVVHLIISPQTKDIEPILAPRHNSGWTIENST